MNEREPIYKAHTRHRADRCMVILYFVLDSYLCLLTLCDYLVPRFFCLTDCIRYFAYYYTKKNGLMILFYAINYSFTNLSRGLVGNTLIDTCLTLHSDII